jgi:hypothetical protein
MAAHEARGQADRLGGLRRFAVAITVLNLLGHTYLGFEQSWAHPFASVLTAYAVELLLELADARAGRRAPKFAGGGARRLVEFLLPAHITGFACAMLLYSNERLGPIIFASAVAICSKALLRARAGRGSRHFFNPSNFGISVTLLVFPWVGIAQPYQFTEGMTGAGDWALPALIVCTGTFLNARFTRRLPLIAAWLGGFAAQAAVRSMFLDTPLVSALLPMTGVAFVLYTIYMVTDPGTTPSSRRGQVTFGLAVAATYGVLLVVHVVFGLFFALSIVCAGRGLCMYYEAWSRRREERRAGAREALPASAAPLGAAPAAREA